MLPTPSTSHVPFDRVYEPAEDSFLLLDALSAPSETAFLRHRFRHSSAPLMVEVGSGSGVVLAFLVANAGALVGRSDVLALAVDINLFACRATSETMRPACTTSSVFLDPINADLGTALRPATVDLLIFNPPYVPTEAVPDRAKNDFARQPTFDQRSHLLELAYAGGLQGMETTTRLLDQLPALLCPIRGMAYVLLCAQNKPLHVLQSIRGWGPAWAADLVASSGKHAGWEKLQVLRIARTRQP